MKLFLSAGLLCTAHVLLQADNRSCPTVCTSLTGANFCNVNAQQLCVSNNAIVNGDLTVCGEIFNPGGQLLNTNFNAEMFFTAGDMSSLQIGQEVDQVIDSIIRRAPQSGTQTCESAFPENKLFACGWEMPLDRQRGITYVSIPFGMPQNINLSITPVLDIHFFTTGRLKEGVINLGIGANFLSDNQDTGNQMTFQKITGNITVSSPQNPSTIRHFMISVPINDTTMKPQSMGLIYMARIDIDKGQLPEYQDSIYIAAANFRYRMEPVA